MSLFLKIAINNILINCFSAAPHLTCLDSGVVSFWFFPDTLCTQKYLYSLQYPSFLFELLLISHKHRNRASVTSQSITVNFFPYPDSNMEMSWRIHFWVCCTISITIVKTRGHKNFLQHSSTSPRLPCYHICGSNKMILDWILSFENIEERRTAKHRWNGGYKHILVKLQILYYFDQVFTGCDMWHSWTLPGKVHGQKFAVTGAKTVHFQPK